MSFSVNSRFSTNFIISLYFGYFFISKINKSSMSFNFTGFDDLFLSSCLSPALTTVRNPIDDMGKNALLLSLDRASGENKFKISPFKTELIVRKSVTDLSKRS